MLNCCLNERSDAQKCPLFYSFISSSPRTNQRWRGSVSSWVQDVLTICPFRIIIFIPRILWNAVTSLGENKVIYDPLPHISFCETQWRHSVKTRLYKTPPPYFIVVASSVKTKVVKVIEFHRIQVITSRWEEVMLLPSGSPSYLCVRFITCFYIYLILTYKIDIQAGFPLTKDPQFQVVENYS